MKQEYIDIICEKLRDKLSFVADAKSGCPERVTFVFSYPNSTVVSGFDVHFDIQCGDKEVNDES